MFDLVIKSGSIYDGTGQPPFKADIGIQGKRIATIEPNLDTNATEVIDAAGLMVCPGFIDVHSHSDLVPFMEGTMRHTRILQGITTDVVGQCGLGPAPFLPKMVGWRQYLKPILGDGNKDLSWDWPEFQNFLDCLGQVDKPHNIASLVTHGAVRAQVIGLENKLSSEADILKMAKIVRDAMKAGAFGLSLGLAYLPGVFASLEELLALSHVVAEYDGILMVHLRSHARDIQAAMEEIFQIAQKSGVKLQISHLRSYGNRAFGTSGKELISRVEDAVKKGVNVTFDEHPYNAGSTLLSQVLPPWAKAGGGGAIVERLKDRQTLNRLRQELTPDGPDYPGWDNYVGIVGWNNILVSSVEQPENKKYQGKTVAQIAEAISEDAISALSKLLISENAQCCMVMLNLFSEQDTIELISHPLCYIGSDGIPTGTPHPRLFGTYPHFLGRYVQKQGILSLAQGIKKITGDPAKRLGLLGRGFLKVGQAADIVIFNPVQFEYVENYIEPKQPVGGMERVIINGKTVVVRGSVIGENAGKVITH